MTFHNTAGDVLSKTELLALTTTVPAPETQYKLTAPVYETFPVYGEAEGNFESASRLRYKAGTVLTASQVDALFTTATVASISPATGVAAGNTAFTITGTNLGGVESVTFGGTAATSLKVVSDTKVTGRTPAHAAGAVTVVVGDDSGPVTRATFFTFT